MAMQGKAVEKTDLFRPNADAYHFFLLSLQKPHTPSLPFATVCNDYYCYRLVGYEPLEVGHCT